MDDKDIEISGLKKYIRELEASCDEIVEQRAEVQGELYDVRKDCDEYKRLFKQSEQLRKRDKESLPPVPEKTEITSSDIALLGDLVMETPCDCEHDPDGYDNIPDLIMAAMKRYRDEHVKPGGFLTAVICNNLSQAIGKADKHSYAALKEIYKWLFNNAPYECIGTPEKMKLWLNKKGD